MLNSSSELEFDQNFNLTLHQFAETALLVKNPKKEKQLISQRKRWRKVAELDDTSKTGLKIGVYEIKVAENKQLRVVTFKGSDFKLRQSTLKDIVNDIDIAFLRSPGQLRVAKDFLLTQLRHDKGDTEIVLLGHSLGGFLAQALSAFYDDKGRLQQFPYLALNGPNAIGNENVLHPQALRGLNVSIATDAIGTFRQQLGPNTIFVKNTGNDNAHTLNTLLGNPFKEKSGVLSDHPLGMANYSIIEERSSPSKLLINAGENKLHHGLVRGMQFVLEERVLALLSTENDENRRNRLLNITLRNIFNEYFLGKPQYDDVGISFELLFRDDEGKLSEVTIVKPEGKNGEIILSLSRASAPDIERANAGTLPIVKDFSKSNNGKASPYAAAAQIAILKAEIENVNLANKHEKIYRNYVISLENLLKKQHFSSENNIANYALTEEAKTARALIKSLQQPDNVEQQLQATENFRLQSNRFRKSLGSHIVYNVNVIAENVVQPILSHFQDASIPLSSERKLELNRAKFIDEQAKAVIGKLDPKKKIQLLHNHLFKEDESLLKKVNRFWNNGVTTQQQWALAKIPARQLAEWQENLQTLPDNQIALEQLQNIKALYFRYLQSEKPIQDLQQKILQAEQAYVSINNQKGGDNILMLKKKQKQLNDLQRKVNTLMEQVPLEDFVCNNLDEDKKEIFKGMRNGLQELLESIKNSCENYADELTEAEVQEHLLKEKELINQSNPSSSRISIPSVAHNQNRFLSFEESEELQIRLDEVMDKDDISQEEKNPLIPKMPK